MANASLIGSSLLGGDATADISGLGGEEGGSDETEARNSAVSAGTCTCRKLYSSDAGPPDARGRWKMQLAAVRIARLAHDCHRAQIRPPG